MVDPSFYKWSQDEIVRDIKEEYFYVSEEPVDERNYEAIRAQNYELPDGQSISLQSERVRFTEQMFQPSEPMQGFGGLHQMVVESISKSDIDIRRDLFQNVIVSGGNSLYKGFLDRLQR